MDKEQIVLDVKNLKQHFNIGSGRGKTVLKAVDGISFQVRKGEVFSLVGESGCGKTTTGRSLIGLYEITDGEITFLDELISTGDVTLVNERKAIKKNTKESIKDLNTQLNENNKDEIANKIAELKKVELEQVKAINEKLRLNKLANKKKHPEVLAAKKEKTDLLKTDLEELKVELNNLKLSQGSDEKLQDIKNQIADLKFKIKDTNSNIMKKMQMIFQDPIASLNPRMTVKEIIAEGLRIEGEKDEDIITEKVNASLDRVGLLPEHANRYPHEFSGGQRQRIGIARALIVEPEFIIADEPISALDISIQAQVINLLNDLRDELGITILFIAHDLSVVKYFSDRIAVMYFGKIVELGEKDQIFANPLHPYTKSLLSAIPFPDPHYEQNREKRIIYSPSMHDYSIDKPEMVEINPGHFIYANKKEIEVYKKELSASKN